MDKPNILLKVVSIIYIIFDVIAGVFFFILSIGYAVSFMPLVVLGVALGIVAGVAGLKAKIRLCKVLAIVLLTDAVISCVMNLMTGNIVSAIFNLVLPVLYSVGVYKQTQSVDLPE